MFIYKEKVTSIAGWSSWQSHCQILANFSQLTKTTVFFLWLPTISFICSQLTQILAIHMWFQAKELLAGTEYAPHWLTAKVAQSQYFSRQKTPQVIGEREERSPVQAAQSRAGSREVEQTRFPAWLGWRAGGKEEERRYFHCLPQNRNSSSQRPRGRGLKRRNDIPPASRVHLQLVFEKCFHKYLPWAEGEKHS